MLLRRGRARSSHGQTTGWEVRFEREEHAEEGHACKDCHPGLFNMKRGATAMTMVGTNGIGDVARKKGSETIHYADSEKMGYLFGLSQQEIIHIYGR